MKKIWSKIKECTFIAFTKPIFHVTKDGRKTQSLIKEASAIGYKSPSAHTPSSIKEDMERLEKIQKELERINFSSKFKNTSNKFLMFIWGLWWMNLGHIMMTLVEDGIGFWGLNVSWFLAYCCYIGWCGRTMIKNKKRRDDLFIEGIG
jgi:hypothetical protein